MAVDVATFRLRYPRLASATDLTIQYWLNDAARTVTVAWADDQEQATLALAAHGLSKSGAVASAVELPAGVTSFRSASFSASVTEASANASTTAEFGSTIYGQEYLRYLRRNFGGPILVGALC